MVTQKNLLLVCVLITRLTVNMYAMAPEQTLIISEDEAKKAEATIAQLTKRIAKIQGWLRYVEGASKK